MRFILIAILLSGCARSMCEISIDNLQPAPKIPKVINIEIGTLIKADGGGQTLLRNYSTMSHEISAIIESCR